MMYIFQTILGVAFILTITKNVSCAANSNKLKTNNQNCTDHIKTIDKCASMATYSFTTPTNRYPQNVNEFKSSCSRITEGIKCLKTLTKCLKPVARTSLTAYMNARSRHSKRLCVNTNDAKTSDFMKAFECARLGPKENLMISREKELISTLQLLSTNSTLKWEDKFHLACCSALSYKTRVLEGVEPECSKFKTPIEDMVNSMVGELLDSACPDQTRLNEVCHKLPKIALPKDWKAASLTGAALDLIIVLSDDKE